MTISTPGRGASAGGAGCGALGTPWGAFWEGGGRIGAGVARASACACCAADTRFKIAPPSEFDNFAIGPMVATFSPRSNGRRSRQSARSRPISFRSVGSRFHAAPAPEKSANAPNAAPMSAPACAGSVPPARRLRAFARGDASSTGGGAETLLGLPVFPSPDWPLVWAAPPFLLLW